MGRLRLVERRTAVRYGAPLAFLVAVTVAAVLVRAGLDSGGSRPPGIAPAATAPVATTTASTPAPGTGSSYRIRSGDTLASVASRFGTTVEHLLELNPGVEPTALRVGQRIRVR